MTSHDTHHHTDCELSQSHYISFLAACSRFFPSAQQLSFAVKAANFYGQSEYSLPSDPVLLTEKVRKVCSSKIIPFSFSFCFSFSLPSLLSLSLVCSLSLLSLTLSLVGLLSCVLWSSCSSPLSLPYFTMSFRHSIRSWSLFCVFSHPLLFLTLLLSIRSSFNPLQPIIQESEAAGAEAADDQMHCPYFMAGFCFRGAHCPMYHGTGLTGEDIDAALAAVSLIGDPEIQLAFALQGEQSQ